MELTLSATPPFSLDAVVNSHGWIRLPPFRRLEEGGLSYVARLNSGRVAEVQVQGDDAGITVMADGHLDDDEQQDVQEQVSWMVGLRQDLSPFYALVVEEPKLAHVAEQGRGRILRSPTLFEDVVKTILTTNTSWGGTIRMVENVVAQFGDPLPGAGSRHAFPPPERLASSDEETLRGSTGLGYRAPYVLDLAQSVAEGQLDLEALKTAEISTAELRQQLLSIRGVGDYAAANLLMLLGRYDHIPVDSWARKVVSHEWYEGQPIARAQVEEAFAHWDRWKGLAYWFWDWSYFDQQA